MHGVIPYKHWNVAPTGGIYKNSHFCMFLFVLSLSSLLALHFMLIRNNSENVH